jgi:hypothetical protein
VSFSEIEEVLYGEIGILPEVAGFIMLGDLQKIMTGFFKREERLMKERWEIARWQVMYFIAPYSKKKNLKASDIAKFNWEKKKAEIPDREKIEEKIKRWDRFKPNG